MLFFVSVAIYLTSLWNKGFILPTNIIDFLKLVLVFSFIYYLIVPFSKIILLPLNIITLGLVSFFVYLLLLHIVGTGLSLLTIKEWSFAGLKLGGFIIQKTHISYFWNLILSSLSLSSIINMLEKSL